MWLKPLEPLGGGKTTGLAHAGPRFPALYSNGRKVKSVDALNECWQDPPKQPAKDFGGRVVTGPHCPERCKRKLGLRDC
jgi:hypothetical protein